MGIKKTHSADRKSGKITQINYTEKRSDGKIETRHVNPNSRKYTGKSVHNPNTGRTKYYTRGEAGMGSGADCFVAKRIYGDANAPEVVTLRRFRDNTLSKYSLGRSFINFYYSGAGQKMAGMIGGTDFTRTAMKKCLDYLVKLEDDKLKGGK